jgi:formylglycine-generating enzyme required for sulfatase activity
MDRGQARVELASSGAGGIPVIPVVAGVVVLGGAAAAWWFFSSGKEEPTKGAGALPAAVVSVPPLLADLPAPPPPNLAGLRLPEGIEDRGGRLFSTVDGAELVLVPGGDFLLGNEEGAEDEKPLRRIQVAAFLVDRHEVTVAQYRRYCQKSGRNLPPQPAGSTDRHPVVSVTWFDAEAYAKWAGRRLPSEAEWEKAGRGTKGDPFPWGAADDPKRRNGPGPADGHPGMAPCGSFPSGAGPFGVLDSLGNAWEWTADWYAADYYLTGPMKDPRGPEAGTEKVVRGGSFLVGPKPFRLTFRNHTHATSRFDDMGFRCAVSPR